VLGVLLLGLGGCATPPQYDPSELGDAGADGDGTGLGSGDASVPLPPAMESGDIVWQVATGFTVEALGHDPQGNILVAGRARPGGLQNEIAIAKYTAAGARLWNRSFGGAGEQGALSLAVSSDGTLVITGGFQGDTSFGEVTRAAAGGTDAFVAAYAPADGRLKSVYTFGGPGEEEGMGVVIDAASGEWLLTGHGGGEFTAGGGTVKGPFVLRLKPDGTVVWARSAGRNLVALGAGGAALFAAGSGVTEQVTRHQPATGDKVWGVPIGEDIHPSAAVADGTGRLLLTGGFYTALNARTPPPIRSFGKRDAFLLALDANTGAPLWEKVILASQGEDSGRAMCSTATGNIFVAGRYFGTPALAPGDPETAQNAFVSRHAANGVPQWTRLYHEGTSASSILCGAPGGIVTGGDGWLMMVLP
jgi:outer membrane protein assembly factor BamB